MDFQENHKTTISLKFALESGTEPFFRELDTLPELRKQSRLANSPTKKFKRFCQTTALGFVTVSRLIAAVGTPLRFQTKGQFWKTCGLAVTTRSSRDHNTIDGKFQKKIKQTNTRDLSRHFCFGLKNVFETAAKKSARSVEFKEYYENLLNGGTRSALARVSLAGKIAATGFVSLEVSNRF